MSIKELDSSYMEIQIVDLLDWISQYGKDHKGGISRLLYTKEWIETQNSLLELLREKGFEAYQDEVGNTFGRLEGTTYKDETILTGSHIDTVVNGGKFDGQLGIIGGIIAMEYLRSIYGEPLRNIEVVSIAEEEGSRFPYTFWGSRNIIGNVSREDVKDLKDVKCIGFVDAMHNAGFDFKDEKDQGRNDIKAFIELHVEQGGVLEIEGKSIGIVEHIVGQRRFTIEVVGESNHAGTTPMKYRKDSLHGSTKIIQQILDKSIEYGEPLVATIGSMKLVPNTVNVVPGKTIFSLDVRHICEEMLVKFTEEIENIVREVSNKMDLKTSIKMYMSCKPSAMDKELVQIIQEQCKNKGLNYKLMHSGAGHDAQIFTKRYPTALIFVPSHKGISHNPDEFTKTKDLVEGINALIETLYYLAYK